MGIVDKIKRMVGQHPDKAKDAVDKAGDAADRRTGGKHARKVDKAQDKAQDYIDRERGERPGS